MSRFEVRCHEWGDDSDYHWSYCNSLEEALKEMKDFHDQDPNNIYERLYVIEVAKDGTISNPKYNPETYEPI